MGVGPRLPQTWGRGRLFPHIPRVTGQVAASRTAPAAPKGIPPSIGSEEARGCGGLGPRPPQSLALLGIGSTAPSHAHSLSAVTRLAIPQADVGRALGAVSCAEFGQVAVPSLWTARPASRAQLWRVSEYQCGCRANPARPWESG